MHNGNMIEGVLIAKTLTLELYKATVAANSADECKSAQANKNKGAL